MAKAGSSPLLCPITAGQSTSTHVKVQMSHEGTDIRGAACRGHSLRRHRRRRCRRNGRVRSRRQVVRDRPESSQCQETAHGPGPFLEAGRKQTGSGKGASGKTVRSYKHTAVSADPAAVRAWARSHKMDVPPRGRIPKRVYEAFEAAN